MATEDLDAWVPEEFDSDVIQIVNQTSVVESEGRKVVMGTDKKDEPRSSGADVSAKAKGAAYTANASDNDTVTLTARKVTGLFQLADEDLKDSPVAVIETKQKDWATGYAVYFDNGTLAVTAAESMPTAPWTSVYRNLSQNDNTVTPNYVANTNITASATATYDGMSAAVAQYEQSEWFSEADTIAIAHPKFKQLFRGIKDDNNRPIFVEGQGGDSGTPDTLFGYRARWSRGAKTSATATTNPDGNPLLIIGNKTMLIRGDRSGPETAISGADTGVGFLTDETMMKMRARRGFACGHPRAFAIFEYIGL